MVADDVRRETIALETVMEATAGARVRVVILDACRNNPFLRSMRMVSGRRQVGGAGLAAVGSAAGGGLLVAYAAAAGATAEDGTGQRNSPYTRALLRHLEAPGVELRVMFGNVGGEVSSGAEQQPFIYTSLTGEHYLNAPAAMVPSPAAVSTRSHRADLGEIERLGLLYSIGGVGLERDDSEAVRLYRLAAEQGDDDAREALDRLGVR